MRISGSHLLRHALFGYFKRLSNFPYIINGALFPGTNCSRFPKQYKLKNIAFSSKIAYILRRTEEIAKKAHLKAPKIYLAENIATIGCQGSFKRPLLLINPAALRLSQGELDFILSHEISHIKHNDIIKKALFYFLILIIDTLFFIIHPLIEAIAFIIEKKMNCAQEIRADKNALLLQKTNQHALSYFSSQLKKHGDNKNDLDHPLFSERIRYCREFPKTLKEVI